MEVTVGEDGRCSLCGPGPWLTVSLPVSSCRVQGLLPQILLQGGALPQV